MAAARLLARSSLVKKRDPPLAVEQRVDARERLDRRPRGGVEAPVVVVVAHAPISRVARRRVLDPAMIEQVDVTAPQPPRARHQKAAWGKTNPSESSGAAEVVPDALGVDDASTVPWPSGPARAAPVSAESGGLGGRQREVTSAADRGRFAAQDVMEVGGGGWARRDPGPPIHWRV